MKDERHGASCTPREPVRPRPAQARPPAALAGPRRGTGASRLAALERQKGRGRRALVRAGLETGCRYGELVRWLEVCDFNPDASTLAIRQSKTGKPRHVVLTAEG